MANHTAVKVGGWVFRDPIEAAEITGIQERLLKCPNFDEGSTHAAGGNIIVTDGGTAARKIAMRTSGELGTSVSHIWSVAGVIKMMSGGKLRLNATMTGMSTNLNLTYNGQQLWIVDDLYGATRVATLLNTGCESGDFIFFLNRDDTNTLVIQGETSGLWANVHPYHVGLAVHYGGVWYTAGDIA